MAAGRCLSGLDPAELAGVAVQTEEGPADASSPLHLVAVEKHGRGFSSLFFKQAE